MPLPQGQRSFRGGRLHVHHSIPFHTIRDEVLNDLNLPLRSRVNEYQNLEIDKIEQLYAQKLMKIEGLPMTHEIHRIFHSIYGNKTNNDHVNDFRRKYVDGELFDKIANANNSLTRLARTLPKLK